MDEHRCQQQGQAGPDDVEAPALPSKSLNLCGSPTPDHGCGEASVTGVHGPYPGEPEVDRVFEVFGTRERVPRDGPSAPHG